MKFIADTHTHTIASTHAYSTLLENIHQAAQVGLECLGMTDHATAQPDSPHIWHFANLTAIPPVVEGVRILKGAECNILDETGRIDLEPEMLRQLEWRIASIHAPCYKKDATLEDNTNAYLGVCENPYIDVIGHSGRGSFRYDYQKLIPLFGERGKLVEINESTLKSPSSRKNCTEIATLCKKYRVPVIVDSDAHFALSIGRFSAAVEMLEEIEFPEELVINADSDRFWHYLEQKGIQKNPEW